MQAPCVAIQAKTFEQCFHVVLILHKRHRIKPPCLVIQAKAFKQYFLVVLSFILYTMVLTFTFMGEILVCDHTHLVHASFDNFWVEVRNLFQIGIFAPHGLCDLNKEKKYSIVPKDCTHNFYTEITVHVCFMKHGRKGGVDIPNTEDPPVCQLKIMTHFLFSQF